MGQMRHRVELRVDQGQRYSIFGDYQQVLLWRMREGNLKNTIMKLKYVCMYVYVKVKIGVYL